MYDYHYQYEAKVSGKVTLTINYKILIHLSIQKTDKFYKDIGNDFEGKFDTSDYSDESINLYNFKRVNEKV